MDEPETMKINEVEYVRKDSLQNIDMSNVSLVRTRNSGVRVGTVESRDATTVTLKNSRRIWRWRGARCLSQLAMEGCDVTSDKTRISMLLPTLELTASDVFEVIPMSEKAASIVMEAIAWKL